MVTPSNFFSGSSLASFDAAFGLVKECQNTPLKDISSEKVGSLFFEIFTKYSPNISKVIFTDGMGHDEIIGSGGFIFKDVFLTAAHVFKTSLDHTFIKTQEGQLLELKNTLICFDLEHDVAIFQLKSPDSITDYPPMKDISDSSLDLGIMHFAHNHEETLVSIGSKSDDDFFELSPQSSIDGGAGSSGGFIFDSTGHLVAIQLSQAMEGYNIRTHLSLSKVLEIYSSSISCFKEKGSAFETPEHGFLDTAMEVDSSRRSSLPYSIIKSSDFTRAAIFIRRIIIEDLLDFYSRGFGKAGTLYREDDLRLDIQNPTKFATNLQLQLGEYTLASVQIPYNLSYFSESVPHHLPFITTISRYSLGQLLKSLKYAKDNYQTITYKVKTIEINHFNLKKILNKTM
jgi:Trypsin-like peptidase domain